MKRLFLFLILSGIFLGSCFAQKAADDKILFGTTIFTMVGPDSIWLGSDSKVVDIDDFANDSLIMCKVHSVRNYYYGIAGFEAEMPRSGTTKDYYDANGIMKYAISKRTDSRSICEFFNDSAKIILTTILNRLKKYHPDEFNVFFRLDYTLEYTMITFRNGIKDCAFYKFVPFISGDSIKLKVEPTFNSPFPTYYRVMGIKPEILRFLATNGTFLYTSEPMKKKIETLIELEVSAYPKFVGRPIETLLIYNGGSSYLPAPGGKCRLDD